VKLTFKHVVSVCSLAAFLACASLIGSAQGQQPTPRQEKPLTPLKVVVTISRWDGTKQTSNLPFTLWVSSNDSSPTTLNVGQRVAYASGPPNPGGPVSYAYQNVGTTMSASATTQEDGRFRLLLNINDTSIAPGSQKDAKDGPEFLSFSANNYLLLRDGQTAQFVAATDKISGEVTKVDVSISVLK